MSQIFVCLNDQANNCLIHLYNKDMPLIGQNTVGQTAAGLTVQMAGEAVWALKKVDLRFLQYEVASVRQQLWSWVNK